MRGSGGKGKKSPKNESKICRKGRSTNRSKGSWNRREQLRNENSGLNEKNVNRSNIIAICRRKNIVESTR